MSPTSCFYLLGQSPIRGLLARYHHFMISTELVVSAKTPQIVITPPIMPTCELCPELRSILNMITSKKSTTVSSDTNENLTTISEQPRSHGQGEHDPDASDTSGSSYTSPSQQLRHCFSSPNVRSEPPQIAPRSKSPQPSYRYSVFSIGTQVVHGKRPWLRRVLDACRCTKGEKSDIHDFARVQPKGDPPPMSSTTMVVDTPVAPMQEEHWREGVRRLLYPRADRPTDIIHSAEDS